MVDFFFSFYQCFEGKNQYISDNCTIFTRLLSARAFIKC